jgi:hypothetical protein
MIKSIHSPTYFIVIIIIVAIALCSGCAPILYPDSNRYGDKSNFPKNLPPIPSPVLPTPNFLPSVISIDGTSTDAFIKVIDLHSHRLVSAFYDKSTSTPVIPVPDGTYEVQYFRGEGWDSKTLSFTRNKSFSSYTFKCNAGRCDEVGGGN